MSDIVQDSSKPTFLYWKQSMPEQKTLCLCYTPQKYLINGTKILKNWPQDKDNMPFGQLPVLKHGDFKSLNLELLLVII